MDRETNEGYGSSVMSEAEELVKLIKAGGSFFKDVDEYEVIINYLKEEGQFVLMQDLVTYAIAQHPNAVSLRVLHGYYLLKSGALIAAMDTASLCVEIEGFNPENHVLLGATYLASKNIESALESYHRAVSVAYENKAKLHFVIGRDLNEYDYYNEALYYLRNACNQVPDWKECLVELATCYAELEQYPKAIKCYNLALDVDPFDKYVWCQFGMLYSKIEHFDESIDAYEFSLAIDPFYETAMFNLANAFASDDRVEKAIECYLEYITLNATDSIAYEYLADCYFQTGNFTKSLDAYKKGVLLDNRSASCLYGIATVLISDEKFEQSITYLEQALLVEPTNSYYQVTLAKVLMTINNFEKAETYFSAILEQSPQLLDNWVNLAAFYGSNEQELISIQTLQKGIKVIGPSAKLYAHIAAYNFMLGYSDEGYDSLRLAHKIDPQECYYMFDDFDLGEDQIQIMQFVEDLNKI